jgi:hypothetical protein
MIHDAMMSPRSHPTAGHDDRRDAQRALLPLEVTLLWHHDPGQVLRFHAVDVSDGGLRVRSSLPLVEGMTGMVLNLLPRGEPVNRSVLVVWARPSRSGQGHEAGLRFF